MVGEVLQEEGSGENHGVTACVEAMVDLKAETEEAKTEEELELEAETEL